MMEKTLHLVPQQGWEELRSKVKRSLKRHTKICYNWTALQLRLKNGE